MLIDPFTVFAQILNFAILAWALKRYLYGRVIEAMDRRESAITARLEEARRTRAEAAETAAEADQRIEELNRDRARRLDEVRSEVEGIERSLLAEARQNVDRQRTQWKHGLESERREVEDAFVRRISEVAIETSRRVLRDLADAELDELVVAAAADRLATDPETWHALLGTASGRATDVARSVDVYTSAELSAHQRMQLRNQLREASGHDGLLVEFRTDPMLLIGVEFRSANTSVSWSAADHVHQVEEIVSGLFDEQRVGGAIDAS